MNPVITQEKKSNTRRFYSGDSLAARLESYLIEKGINEIGDNANDQLRQKYEIKVGSKIGEVRPIGLAMSHEERLYRLKDICFLDEELLSKLHAYEQTRMVRFILTTDEMRGILKIGRDKLPSQVKMSPEEFEGWGEVLKKSYPPMGTFKGLPIPPYFIYDLNFDGMNYHHAIDRKAWKIKHPEEVL